MRAALALLAFSLLTISALGSRSLTQSDVKKMGETHSGAAAGVVTPATAGNKGAEKKIGEWIPQCITASVRAFVAKSKVAIGN
jgi:hypothetical protein